MKKLIVVIMALIAIFSASVSAYAMSSGQIFVDWEIVNTILNLQQNSQNCTIVKYNTARPTPSMTDGTGAIKTQKTTYNVLLDLYETVTVENASWADNVATFGRFEWYKYGNYCWIRYIPDTDTNICWVANYQGKILYCDAPVSETSYTISAIAGATGYCLTTRPAGTTGNGYLGDLLVTQDNLTTIHGVVDVLGSDVDYYMVLRIINGEYRYYIIGTYPNRTQYFVCNTSGQLFYALKDEPEDVSGSTGGTFDATEVVTALNSIYNKLDSGFRVVTKGINEANNRITSFNDDFIIHMNNTVSGLSAANGTLNTIADYLSGLMNKQLIERKIIYSGNDVFIDWDESKEVIGVSVDGVDNNIYVKSSYGEPKMSGGYTYSFGSSYKLIEDDYGYPMLVFAGEYPDTPNPPDGTVLYYNFDDSSVEPIVGESAFTITGTAEYGESFDGAAYVFTEGTSALTGSYTGGLFNADNKAFTISTWVYPTGSPTMGYIYFKYGASKSSMMRIDTTGAVSFYYYTGSTTSRTLTTGKYVTTNEWNHLAVCYDGTTLSIFVNGEMFLQENPNFTFPTGNAFKIYSSSSGKMPIGTMVDEFVVVDGAALWSADFDPYEEAIFSGTLHNYYLYEEFPKSYSYSRPMTPEERVEYDARVAEQYPDGVPEDFEYNYLLYFMKVWASQDLCYGLIGTDTPAGDTTGETTTVTPPTTMGRIGDDVSYIFYDRSVGEWRLYDCVSKEVWGVSNFPIDLDTFFYNDTYMLWSADAFNRFVFCEHVVGKPVWLDIPDGGTVTVTYIDYVNWFDSIYSLIDMQIDQLTAISQKVGNSVGDTIINIENTVVEIAPDNDAFNIFYIEKTDGTTESVGETATDAAVFVGDILSMFYRLVFEDALDNVDILNDFESVFSDMNSGV